MCGSAAQIPDNITINYSATAGDADTLDSMESSEFGDGYSLDAADGAPVNSVYVDNNGNVFIKPCFELVAPSQGEALPVLMEHGTINSFVSCRDEGNSSIFARVLNDSTKNEFDLGYGSLVGVKIEDLSRYPASWVSVRRLRVNEEPGTVLFISGPVHTRACYYDGQFEVHVAGMHITTSSSAEVYRAYGGIIITDSYIEVPSNRGLGLFIDTSRHKRFVVRKAVLPGYGGRVYVRCYDPNGHVLGDSDPEHPYVKTKIHHRSYFSPLFGGAYLEGSDSERDFYFWIAPHVKKIAIFLAGGTHVCRLRGFSIFSVDGRSSATLWPGYQEVIPGANMAETSPIMGTWEQGRLLFNAQPAQGEPIGWICVESGEPGTWEPFGMIGSR